MEIVLNGESREVDERTSVAALLARFGIPPVRVAVERNREIVPRRLYGETILAPGDKLEVVTFVGGG